MDYFEEEKNKEKENQFCSSLYFDDGLLDTFLNAFPVAQKYKKTGTLAIATGCVASHVRSNRFMNKEQIKIMIKEGWKIASHGVTHRPFVQPKYQPMGWAYKHGFFSNFLKKGLLPSYLLKNLSDKEIEWELIEGKKWITEELGVSPACFVVPYSVFTEQQKKLILNHYSCVREGIVPFHNIGQNPKERQRFINVLEGIEEVNEITKKIDPQHSISGAEGEWLYNTAKECKGEGVIVEIGSWKGKSTIYLAKGSEAGNNIKVYAVDPHTGSPIHKKMYGKVWTFEDFKKNIKEANIGNVIPIVKTSEQAENGWREPVELLWIDGNHEYEFAKLDFEKWFPHLINSGIIAFHDTIFHLNKGPKKVVINNIYKSNKFINIRLVGSITFAQKVDNAPLKERLKNRYSLFLRYVYEFLSPRYWLMHTRQCIKVIKDISLLKFIKWKN